jgi:ATP-dependent Lon protease
MFTQRGWWFATSQPFATKDMNSIAWTNDPNLYSRNSSSRVLVRSSGNSEVEIFHPFNTDCIASSNRSRWTVSTVSGGGTGYGSNRLSLSPTCQSPQSSRRNSSQQLCALAPGEFKTRLIAPSAVAAHEAEDLKPRTTERVDDRLNTEAVVGAVTGLAVLTQGDREYGGDTILIQVSAINGSTGVTVTGLHGRTLKDSVQAVYNLIRANFRELAIPEQRLKTQALAVHLVKIAEPKDGPSAGLAFLVGMVSALTNRPIKPGFAFSGEVALHGEVGPVGGLPHKIAAAVKAGRKTVVIPASNSNVIDQLPEDIREAIDVKPVASAREALALALV